MKKAIHGISVAHFHEIYGKKLKMELLHGEVLDILGLPGKFQRSEEEKAQMAAQQQEQLKQQQDQAAAMVEAEQNG